MTYQEMDECEWHLAEIYAHVWDEAYRHVLKNGQNELDEPFLKALYELLNKQCSNLENFDIQFDTFDFAFKAPGHEKRLKGICYVAYVTYQIEQEPFEFAIYYGERAGDELVEKSCVFAAKHGDVVCKMSADDDQKEQHFLDHFSQIKFVP